MKTTTAEKTLSRRRVLQVLASMGVTGPAALELAAQVRRAQISPETMKTANALVDQQFSEERLRIAAAALQRSLDQFQLVRDLEIPDSVEPALLFHARGR